MYIDKHTLIAIRRHFDELKKLTVGWDSYELAEDAWDYLYGVRQNANGLAEETGSTRLKVWEIANAETLRKVPEYLPMEIEFEKEDFENFPFPVVFYVF